MNVGEVAHLDGTGSSDPDGNPLTYTWSITSAPSGSNATLTNPTSSKPSLTPDIAGTYTVRLVVNDGALNSNPDTMTVTATSAGRPPSAAGACKNAHC